MRQAVVGRLLRMARFRRGWTQRQLALRARISPATVSRIEGGEALRYRLETIQRHGEALGMRVELQVTGRGGETDRLLDDEHAAIAEYVARLATASGWLVAAEASFSVYGERGRIDVLAFDPRTGVLLVVEVKSEIANIQELFGSLGVKERHARSTAAERGWSAGTVAVLLAVASADRNHRIVRAHPILFARFERHAGRIHQWLRRPRPTSGLLLYVPAAIASRPGWMAARRRVRHRSVPHDRPWAVNSGPVHVIRAAPDTGDANPGAVHVDRDEPSRLEHECSARRPRLTEQPG